MSFGQKLVASVIAMMFVLTVVFAAAVVIDAGNNDVPEYVCLRGHTVTTRESWDYGMRVGSNNGLSVGLDGGIGMGFGLSMGNGVSYGPTYKPAKTVEVCDEWATPTPEVVQ